MDYDNLTSLPAMFFANTSAIGDRLLYGPNAVATGDRPQGRMHAKGNRTDQRPGVTRRIEG